MSTYIVPLLALLIPELHHQFYGGHAMRVRFGFREFQTFFTVSAVPSALMRLKMESGRLVSMRTLTVPSGSSNALLIPLVERILSQVAAQPI